MGICDPNRPQLCYINIFIIFSKNFIYLEFVNINSVNETNLDNEALFVSEKLVQLCGLTPWPALLYYRVSFSAF